jgi:hypothetical protein
MDPLSSIRRLGIIATSLLGFGLTACAELFGPQYALQPGEFNAIIGGPLVTIPDTAAVSAPLGISARTSGDGCRNFGTTDVTIVDAFTVEIRPYDYAQVNPTTCTTILKIFNHQATVQFARPGIATVRVIGHSAAGIDTIAHAVLVQ